MTRGAVLVAVLCWLGSARADGILVVAPHPDDEVLMAGGVLYDALRRGEQVNVVVVTNGDYFGTDVGLLRQRESVDGLGALGLPESRVVFLGYPDGGLLPLWNNAPRATQAYLSRPTGRTTTYGEAGFGRTDFHTAREGTPAAYNRPALVEDMHAALDRFRPDDIFVTGPCDQHPDHRGTFYAVRDALRLEAGDDASYRPLLHTTIVHDPVGYPFDDFWPADQPRETPPDAGDDDLWPNPALASRVPLRFAPGVPFLMPPSLPRTILRWDARESLPVPPAMAAASRDANLKAASLARYASQVGPVLLAHVKADEIFWAERVRVGRLATNVARAATVAASSAAPAQVPAAAVDGVVDGAPENPAAEWVAADASLPAFLRLGWTRPRLVDHVVLFDRVSLADHVIAGRLALDDGTVVPFGPLANDGRGDELVLPGTRRVTAATVFIDQDVGTPGLAEIEVFAAPPTACLDDVDCAEGDSCSTPHCRAGRCVAEPVADGAVCGDSDACNGVETCRAGACRRDPGPDCDDGDPCTRDHCASPGACVHDVVCRPVPARGPAGCRIAFAGLPPSPCADGDPACDADETVNGACRFDAVLCVTGVPVGPGCGLEEAVGAIEISGPLGGDLAALPGLLRPRLPVESAACVGPVPLRVATRGRRARARVPIRVTTVAGVVGRASVRVACLPASTERPHRRVRRSSAP